jgi:hypothetical protein
MFLEGFGTNMVLDKRSNRTRLTEKPGSHSKVDALKEDFLEVREYYILTLSSS